MFWCVSDENAIDRTKSDAKCGNGGHHCSGRQELRLKWQRVQQTQHILTIQFAHVLTVLFDVVVDVFAVQPDDGQLDDDALLLGLFSLLTIDGVGGVRSGIFELPPVAVHVDGRQLPAVELLSRPIHGIQWLFSGFYLLWIIF